LYPNKLLSLLPIIKVAVTLKFPAGGTPNKSSEIKSSKRKVGLKKFKE
jgi:hypothetical protein